MLGEGLVALSNAGAPYSNVKCSYGTVLLGGGMVARSPVQAQRCVATCW